MTTIDRRALLATAAASAMIGALPRFAFAAASPASAPTPPVARMEPVTETFFGTAVTDNYRWMEDPKDQDWAPYMKAHADHARSTLDGIPGLKDMKARVEQLSGDMEVIQTIVVAGPNVFIEKRPAGANNFQLFVRPGMNGTDTLLLDPESRTLGETHYALNYWSASPDGKYVVLGLSPGGGEQAVIEIHDVASNTALPERIDRAQYANLAWLPDSSGFFFNRLAEGAAPGSIDFYKNSVCWLHKLNTDPKTDVKVLAKGQFPEVEVQDIEFPGVATQPGSDIVVAALVAGVQNEITFYVNSLAAASAGKGGWQKICSPEDKVTNATFKGHDIYLLTYKDAPRYQVLQVNADSPAIVGARMVVPESDVVVQNLYAAKDGIYIGDLKDGIAALRRYGNDGAIASVALPVKGSLGTAFADPTLDGMIFSLQSWVHPDVIYKLDASGTVSNTGLAAKPTFDVSGYDSVEVLAPAKDGVTVPLSIVFKKGIAKDGSAPALIQAYGSYGIDQDPYFAPRMIAFLERGGVWAVAHVRGGGERGREWHEAGRLLKKPNTWGDLIACGEHMIAEKWTSASKLAINGGSAGGITMGRSLTDRPDLFAAVISNVGVHNPLRAEFSPNGPPNVPEFGSVTTEDGFKGLYAMDSTQHVKPGTAYPAVLLTTGINDPRVEPWEVSKLCAHLTAATTSGKPILMRVDYQAGHGIGSTRAQRDGEVADMFALIFWQAGDKAFRPG